jgi:prolipoprotein diacylglyceryltransferase
MADKVSTMDVRQRIGDMLNRVALRHTVSVITGRLLALRLAERAGLDTKVADRCAVWTLAGAVVGARLLFVVTNLDQFDRVVDVVV